MNHHSCSDHSCCSASTTPSVHQTLEELDFQRGIWSAAMDGDADKVRSFLSRGVDPNLKDPYGYTALHYASRSGHAEICQLLLSEGANPNIQTRAGGATPLHRAAYCGHNHIVRLLLKYNADPCICDEDGKTPQQKAFECGHISIVQCLKNGT